jgi:hypothetical protein
MARTHFQDFTRTDGTAITVEYTVEGRNSPTTYSPVYGADGGDAAEFGIIKAWRTDTGEDVELPDAEREGYEEWLAANVDPDDFYDPPEAN